MVACFLPAVDLRDRRNGDVLLPGVRGYFWSSTPSIIAHSAWHLRFHSAEVRAGFANSTQRPWGMSVRCVQEFTEKKSGLNFSSFVLRD